MLNGQGIKYLEMCVNLGSFEALQSNHGDHLCTLLDRLLDRHLGALGGEAAVGAHRVAALLQTFSSCSEDEVSRVNLITSRMGRRPLLDWEPSPGRWQLIVYPSPADLIGRGDGSCSQYGYIGYTGLHRSWRWGGNMINFRHVSDVWCTYLIWEWDARLLKLHRILNLASEEALGESYSSK